MTDLPKVRIEVKGNVGKKSDLTALKLTCPPLD